MENETDIKLESLTEDALSEIIKERDEAKSLAEKNQQSLNNVVEELKELRQKKEAQVVKPIEGVNIDELIAAKFKEVETAQQAKVLVEAQSKAREKFMAEHKEFSPENDPSGIRRAALESKLSRFNLGVAKSEDDALEILNDAYELLSRREQVTYTNEAAPLSAGSSNKHVDKSGSLTGKEIATMQRLNWTREKFIDMKLKHPELVSELFK
jgi:hypothetical protein